MCELLLTNFGYSLQFLQMISFYSPCQRHQIISSLPKFKSSQNSLSELKNTRQDRIFKTTFTTFITTDKIIFPIINNPSLSLTKKCLQMNYQPYFVSTERWDKGNRWKPLNIFPKCSILNVWLGFASESFMWQQKQIQTETIFNQIISFLVIFSFQYSFSINITYTKNFSKTKTWPQMEKKRLVNVANKT